MSVAVCVATSLEHTVCAWVYTCACGEFRSAEFATHEEAYKAFVAHHEGAGIPAHIERWCDGVLGGGVQPAHEEPWEGLADWLSKGN